MAVSMSFEPGLYVTATPIGNLKDITFRAIEILQQADLILCEDKRVTAKLCQAYDIKTQLTAYHDHNGEEMRPQILERLQNDQVIALVSDAGTPLISDPGYKLVRDVREAGITVYTIPGACAAIAGLTIAGAPTDQFLFAGFLPTKTMARKKMLTELKSVVASLVFYETGPRLADALLDIGDILGDREIAIARELTKLHEEVRTGMAPDLAAHYSLQPPRGEIVLVVHPPQARQWSEEELTGLMIDLLAENSVKDAASLAAELTSMSRKTLYNLALGLKRP
ncbi:16S rRNA (cytidine(1402)-2'-O)-methyltransferase [Parvularcula sp. IMCC14364]|uniref:16S rRNA (cytidine(1402)-2'-O)-methyltransferase n=1 Tax=Parvularcula sp. IMCC14364 TaxID=3067902 RepID=UPI002740547B|nr:16S rRNA (cytidine(1402)-2'-O)-methyltransferase [Parvularcula sp. IMCC14364]